MGSDGLLVAEAGADRRVISRVPVTGGTSQVLITLRPTELPEGPQMLPDGDTVLFTLGVNARVGAERWDKAQIVAQSLKTGTRKILVDGGSDGRYVPTGHLAYAVGGIVYAVPFNLRTLTVTGDAVPIIEGVRRAVAGVSGFAEFSFSDSGTLAYVPGPATTGAGVAFALIDREGTLTALKIPPGMYTTPRASPDGSRIALQSFDGKNTFIGVYQTSGSAGLRRITFEGNSTAPVWSSDGKRVAFQSSRDGDLAIFAQAADGTGAPERLTKAGAGESHVPESWSPSGDVLLFDVVTPKEATLWQLSLKDGKTAPFGGVRSIDETGAVFSPDGRWVAYAASNDRTTDMFVQPFPATGARYVLVRGRADSPHHPIWAPDGSALYYVPAPGAFERVGVVTAPTFSFGNPDPVVRPFQASPPSSHRMYDMLPDGRILGLITPGQSTGTVQPDEIDVVLNWFEELKSRVPR